MALPELLRTLREQAAERRADELARAEDAARRIRTEVLAASSRRREEYMAAVRQAEEEAARRSLSRIRVKAARSVLSARDELLLRVRSALLERIDEAEEEPAYRDALAREVEIALGRLPAGPVRLVVRPASSTHLPDGLVHGERVTVEEDPALGAGFRAISEVEGMEVDGLLRSTLDRDWKRLAVHVLSEMSS